MMARKSKVERLVDKLRAAGYAIPERYTFERFYPGYWQRRAEEVGTSWPVGFFILVCPAGHSPAKIITKPAQSVKSNSCKIQKNFFLEILKLAIAFSLKFCKIGAGNSVLHLLREQKNDCYSNQRID